MELSVGLADIVPRLLIPLLLHHVLLHRYLLLNLALLFSGSGSLLQAFKLPLVICRGHGIGFLELVSPSADLGVFGLVQTTDAAFPIASLIQVFALNLLCALEGRTGARSCRCNLLIFCLQMLGVRGWQPRAFSTASESRGIPAGLKF